MINILLVEDNTEFRAMIADNLSDHYTLIQAESGAAALLAMTQQAADIALIDVRMPGMDGYETCVGLRRMLPEIRVIFMSGDDTMEARMAAYEAGADDFLAKPFRVAELLLKLHRMEQVIATSGELKASVQQATDVAMTAMINAGEMGCLLNFTRNLAISRDVDSLLRALVSSICSGFGLVVTAQVRTTDQQATLDSQGRSSPLEAEMLRCFASETQRIYSFGRRLVINYPRITLHLKEMPTNDEVRCGRLRDHLASLVDVAEYRLDGILLELQFRQQQVAMQEAMTATRQQMQELDGTYRSQAQASMDKLEALKREVDDAMLYLGLTERQEGIVMDLVGKSVEEAGQVYAAGLAMQEKFSNIVTTLGEVQTLVPMPALAPMVQAEYDSVVLF